MIEPIVHNQERVLTTVQIAEAYETTTKRISYNFNYHKNRYEEGKHFYTIAPESKKAFLERYPEIQDNAFNHRPLYLWTKKGAFMHAKSLNTDQAWAVYESLVDGYFELVEQQHTTSHSLLPKTWAETLRLYADEVDRRVEAEQRLAIAAPKIHKYDLLADAEGLYSMNDVAAIYHSNGVRLACDVRYRWGEGYRIAREGTGITTVVFYTLCRDANLIYQRSTCPVKRGIDKNWFVRIMRDIGVNEHGKGIQKSQTYVTGNGVFGVLDTLYKQGYITYATLDLTHFTQGTLQGAEELLL